MSLGGLVAYGDSDDSEDEICETKENGEQTKPVTKVHQEPEVSAVPVPVAADRVAVSHTHSKPKAKLQAEQSGVVGTVDDIEDDELPIITAHTPFSILKLPAPKHTTNDELFSTPLPMVMASKLPDTNLLGENILEETSQPISGQMPSSTSSLLGLPVPKKNAVKPTSSELDEDEIEDEIKKKTIELKTKAEAPPKKSQKQPVRITIPELPQYGNDEDEIPSSKRAKLNKPTGGGRSGLFSLLPSPKNLSVKTTNRPLLPHTLKIKRTTTAPLTKSVKRPAPKPVMPHAVAEPDSDEELEGPHDSQQGNFFSLTDSCNPDPAAQVDPASTSLSPVAAPSLTGPWQNPTNVISLPHVVAFDNAKPVDPGDTTEYAEPLSNQNVDITYGVQDEETSEVQQYLQDEEFLKLAGRRQRGREQIDIIDVHGEHDITQEELTKQITEEVVPGYSYSKKGKDNPSTQQRRKHQITYLAHQAKEREMELKNTWSSSRQSKRQTQAKYGF